MENNFELAVLEKFVNCRKVVVVRWSSDDPDYYRPEIDLFDYQKSPIPPTFGKKDKQTTEQVSFEN